MAVPTITTDTFKAKALRCDTDALILLGVAAALALATLAGLAFLPDAAWNRLVERSRLIWLAIPSVVAVIVAMHGRFRVRAAGAAAFGQAAAAVGPEIARAEVYAAAAAAQVAPVHELEPTDEDIAEAQAFHAKLAADPTHNGTVMVPRGADPA